MNDQAPRLTPPPATTVSDGTIEYLRVDDLRESPTNPRRTFAKLEELAASMRAVGVQVSLVVRPDPDLRDKFELICGARRLRAAKLAGLALVPCDVRRNPLTEEQLRSLQLTENLQRDDLDVIEEAEGLDALHGWLGMTPEQIAARLGKSVSTVYARLKLLALCAEGRQAVVEGKWPASAAVALARLPHELQAKALRSLGGTAEREAPTAREALRFLQLEFTFNLARAPFEPDARQCEACPKRTKNMPASLFDDLGSSADVCTDTACFAEQCRAAWAETAAKVKEDEPGAEVLSTKEGAALFRHGEALPYGSRYVRLDSVNHADPRKRTWAELRDRLGPSARPPLIVAPDTQLRRRDLADRGELVAALADAGAKWAKDETKRSKPAKGRPGDKAVAADLDALEVKLRAVELLALDVGTRIGTDPPALVWQLMLPLLGVAAPSRVLKDIVGSDTHTAIEAWAASKKRKSDDLVRAAVAFTLATVGAEHLLDTGDYPKALARVAGQCGSSPPAFFETMAHQEVEARPTKKAKTKKKPRGGRTMSDDATDLVRIRTAAEAEIERQRVELVRRALHPIASSTPTPAMGERVARLRAALDYIACWEDGPTVDGTFDEPHSARKARAALTDDVAGAG